jgi:hypothetical protein
MVVSLIIIVSFICGALFGVCLPKLIKDIKSKIMFKYNTTCAAIYHLPKNEAIWARMFINIINYMMKRNKGGLDKKVNDDVEDINVANFISENVPQYIGSFKDFSKIPKDKALLCQWKSETFENKNKLVDKILSIYPTPISIYKINKKTISYTNEKGDKIVEEIYRIRYMLEASDEHF